MPKKKPGMTPEQQKAAFEAEVERLVRAGELDRVEANTRLDQMVRKAKPRASGPAE